ncbi:hypothetical protein O181_089819 [Austropuccinia psidii MF-1]|uniref:Reverse transcriptase domain-containing protein n=1 Tax=Austropuccinia psidii MF-1 TaxID=1389203 RepID=A0A9Q3IUE1_9BASI|nr:hypothetical protein [Austropuccinia psidii MF-1]
MNSPKGDDLILGYDFLYQINPIIDWKNQLITYDYSHKDFSGILPSASDDFATAVNSVALVGELETPSLPSSVHIPSIIPSQSLLPLRDAVFKEIKDVGEDLAISSLHLFQGDMDPCPLSFHSSLEEQCDEEEEPEQIETVLKVVPPSYHQYYDVFSMVKAEKRSPHCACDHHIKLEGLLPPIGVIYSLSNQESETLGAYISENVEKGFIRPSSSSTGAPVLFVKKKDGCLRLCLNYHKLNAVTRKSWYPVPPMNQLLTVFNISTMLSKLDLRGAYHHLRIQEGDEDLTSFTTKYGSYEYLVMPFGLTNAPAFFQKLVNDIFADFLDLNYSKKLTSLTSLLKKYSPFIFNEEGLSQFQILKEAITPSPILPHFNLSLPTIVETDASDYAFGAVLIQVNDSGKHPIAFDSCKLLPAEINYEIHDKELLGIFWSLKRLRAFLLSLSNPFEVMTDHSSLQYFMSSKVLTRHQDCWAEFLSEFYFTITYHPGRLTTLPDALSRRDGMYPERGWTSSARILKIFIKESSKMEFKSQDSLQSK